MKIIAIITLFLSKQNWNKNSRRIQIILLNLPYGWLIRIIYLNYIYWVIKFLRICFFECLKLLLGFFIMIGSVVYPLFVNSTFKAIQERGNYLTLLKGVLIFIAT